MFGAKTHANVYQAGIAKLEKVEILYQQALDNLQAGIDQHRASDVPGLRRKVAETEQAVIDALQAAGSGWFEHWRARAVALEPQLLEAAITMQRYNAFCKVIGIGGAVPAQSFIQTALISPLAVDLFDDSGVPTEAPDSALLDDFKGVWR